MLQQRLPLAVLKPDINSGARGAIFKSVATALTACGIETRKSSGEG